MTPITDATDASSPWPFTLGGEDVRGLAPEQVERHYTPAKASNLRTHNDMLFAEENRGYMPRYLTNAAVADGQGYKSQVSRIRRAMLQSGRHIDAALFNEGQKRVALKRLLGMLGRQIL